MNVISRARLAVAAAALALGTSAFAVDSIKMMIPANPGGGWDTTGRELGKALQASGVKSVQFDNKGGAAGTIGLAQFVNSAKGDPNAVLIGGMVMVGGIILNKSAVNLSQVTPIARLTSEWEVIVVPANSPHKTMADLVKAFKADPGKVSWGGGSAGGTDHITAGLVAKAVGVDPTKVNYIAFSGGGEAMAAILGGKVAAGISGVSEFTDQVAAGKMRALAVSGAERVEGFDAPTIQEAGFDVELTNWRGVVAPPGISDEDRQALGDAVGKMVESEAWQTILKERAWLDVYLPPDEFAQFLQQDSEQVETVLKDIGLVQ